VENSFSNHNLNQDDSLLRYEYLSTKALSGHLPKKEKGNIVGEIAILKFR
jgi:hypothetical protein